jgi:hypothetical protein
MAHTAATIATIPDLLMSNPIVTGMNPSSAITDKPPPPLQKRF